MPKISIIIPVYNDEMYLEKCMDSVINQTLKDIEIIIVDDGSSDNSEIIYGSYATQDPRIKIIKKKNEGVSAARNDGINISTGEYLMFIDSDDWLTLDACEAMYNEAIRSRADMIVADIFLVKDVSKVEKLDIFKHSFTTDDKEFIKQYEMTCIGYGYNPDPAIHWAVAGVGSPWNKLYSHDVIKKNALKFDTYVSGIYDDNLFTLYNLANIERLSYIKKPVYYNRIVSNSLTFGYRDDTIEINSRIFERIHNFINKYQHKNAADFEKAFYIYVIRRLDKSLGTYFFSKQNKDSFHSKLKKLKTLIQTEPYIDAIKRVDSKRLIRSQAITLRMAKFNSALLLWSSFQIRRIYNYFKNK